VTAPWRGPRYAWRRAAKAAKTMAAIYEIVVQHDYSFLFIKHGIRNQQKLSTCRINTSTLSAEIAPLCFAGSY